jgi:hypothetical protein
VRACCPSALIEGSLEVGEHQDVEQLGAGGAEGVQALPEPALELVRPHARRLRCERLERNIQRLNPAGQSTQSAASVMVALRLVP